MVGVNCFVNCLFGVKEFIDIGFGKVYCFGEIGDCCFFIVIVIKVCYGCVKNLVLNVVVMGIMVCRGGGIFCYLFSLM